MTRRVRKFFLTAHVTFSVGWFGSVAAFLVLAIVGFTSKDIKMVRASYIAMQLITSFIIIPLSFASLLTGLIQSLRTRWGLFRHYWIMFKLLLATLSVIVLLIHTQPISNMANIAAKVTVLGVNLRGHQIQLIVAPGAALLVFITAITLAVYKPRGMTRYGWRKYKGVRS